MYIYVSWYVGILQTRRKNKILSRFCKEVFLEFIPEIYS